MNTLRTLLPHALLLCTLGLPLVSGCSFTLTERKICPDGGCPEGTVDMASPVDMVQPRTDPNADGPYLVASQELTVPASLNLAQNKLTVVWPSDDGKTASAQQKRFPLVLMLPAQSLSQSQMRTYSDRLATHGIAVALVTASDERRQVRYRDSVLALIPYLAQMSDVKDRIIADHIGIFGYQLGGMIALSSVARSAGTLRSALVADPVAVLSFVEPLDGLGDATAVNLGRDTPLFVLGELLSKMSEPGILPCTPADANYEQFYSRVTGSAAAVTFPGATLADFVNTYPDNCGTPITDRSITLRVAVKLTTAYFQWTLLDRASAKDYLLGENWLLDRNRYGLTQVKKGI